jgi:hypothetical protein
MHSAQSTAADQEQSFDCEKAAMLGQSLSDPSNESFDISITEALNDRDATPRSLTITISQLLAAPSIRVLLASFSILSLHSATFDILLPHLGHTASHQAGLGIDCSWLNAIKLGVSFLAAMRILKAVPFVIERVGLLPMYRRMSWAFPDLYLLIPLFGFGMSLTGAAPLVAAIVNTIAMLAKATLTGAAQVLVILLVLSAAPDAQSTGTVIGILSISQLFKALAVGITGMAYYLSDAYSMLAVNGTLFGTLAGVALVGAIITRKLRETPRVGTDIPAGCFVWQDVFDAESDADERL